MSLAPAPAILTSIASPFRRRFSYPDVPKCRNKVVRQADFEAFIHAYPVFAHTYYG